jgi:hypothetical protein
MKIFKKLSITEPPSEIRGLQETAPSDEQNRA